MKDSVARMKTQAIDWEKISAKHIPDKGLISSLEYINNSKCNFKRPNDPDSKWVIEIAKMSLNR